MDINKLSSGKNAPHEINVIIEVPMGSAPIKYELDKDSGFLFVDRFIQASMNYPCNYGFIPHSLSGDGDPADVLVYGDLAVVPMSVISARPIGVLLMEDESGLDEKILAVPTSKLTPFFDHIKSYKDLPEIVTLKIAHFFENYKKLEKNKWVKIIGWESMEKAHELILEATERFKKS